MSIKINNTELYDVNINGTHLTQTQLYVIAQYYNACKQAEFAMERFGLTDVKQAIDMGKEVQDLIEAKNNPYPDSPCNTQNMAWAYVLNQHSQ